MGKPVTFSDCGAIPSGCAGLTFRLSAKPGWTARAVNALVFSAAHRISQ
jgi:hypothetical protein